MAKRSKSSSSSQPSLFGGKAKAPRSRSSSTRAPGSMVKVKGYERAYPKRKKR